MLYTQKSTPLRHQYSINVKKYLSQKTNNIYRDQTIPQTSVLSTMIHVLFAFFFI
jgi:hypothetical protein